MNEAPAYLRPYKALSTRDFFPARSEPNYEANVVQIFSEQGVVRYALWMSDVLTSTPFNSANVIAMRTLSQEKTRAYINVGGAKVV